MNKLKVKLFTHSDLDGIGCSILARLAFDEADVHVVDYHDVDHHVSAFIQNQQHLNYDKVFITDISVMEEIAKDIDSLDINNFTLLDHHKTAEWLNQYRWATVNVNGLIGKESGTNMFYEYLIMNGYFSDDLYSDALSILVEKIRRYDTWEWKDLYNDEMSADLNNLFWLLGRDKFENKFLSKLKAGKLFKFVQGCWVEMFDLADEAILEMDRNKRHAYFKSKNKELKKVNGAKSNLKHNYKFGIVFAEQYISELGNYLSEENRDLDFVAIIDLGKKKVSLRTVHDHIDLGKEIASEFGGGGHPKASGFQLDEVNQALVATTAFSPKLMDKLVDMFMYKGVLGKVNYLLNKTNKTVDALFRK